MNQDGIKRLPYRSEMQAVIMQNSLAVGPDDNAAARFRQDRSALPHVDLAAGALKCKRHAQASDSGSDNQNLHVTPRHTVIFIRHIYNFAVTPLTFSASCLPDDARTSLITSSIMLCRPCRRSQLDT